MDDHFLTLILDTKVIFSFCEKSRNILGYFGNVGFGNEFEIVANMRIPNNLVILTSLNNKKLKV